MNALIPMPQPKPIRKWKKLLEKFSPTSRIRETLLNPDLVLSIPVFNIVKVMIVAMFFTAAAITYGIANKHDLDVVSTPVFITSTDTTANDSDLAKISTIIQILDETNSDSFDPVTLGLLDNLTGDFLIAHTIIPLPTGEDGTPETVSFQMIDQLSTSISDTINVSLYTVSNETYETTEVSTIPSEVINYEPSYIQNFTGSKEDTNSSSANSSTSLSPEYIDDLIARASDILSDDSYLNIEVSSNETIQSDTNTSVDTIGTGSLASTDTIGTDSLASTDTIGTDSLASTDTIGTDSLASTDTNKTSSTYLDTSTEIIEEEIVTPVAYFESSYLNKLSEEIFKISSFNNYSEANTSSDLNLLLKIVNAESGNQSSEGRSAVAEVIFNRIQSSYSSFASQSTIYDVVYTPKQFSPVSNGSLYTTVVSEKTFEAVKVALTNSNYANGATFFLNPSLSSASNLSWFYTLQWKATIGAHEFRG